MCSTGWFRHMKKKLKFLKLALMKVLIYGTEMYLIIFLKKKTLLCIAPKRILGIRDKSRRIIIIYWTRYCYLIYNTFNPCQFIVYVIITTAFGKNGIKTAQVQCKMIILPLYRKKETKALKSKLIETTNFIGCDFTLKILRQMGFLFRKLTNNRKC